MNTNKKTGKHVKSLTGESRLRWVADELIARKRALETFHEYGWVSYTKAGKHIHPSTFEFPGKSENYAAVASEYVKSLS